MRPASTHARADPALRGGVAAPAWLLGLALLGAGLLAGWSVQPQGLPQRAVRADAGASAALHGDTPVHPRPLGLVEASSTPRWVGQAEPARSSGGPPPLERLRRFPGDVARAAALTRVTSLMRFTARTLSVVVLADRPDIHTQSSRGPPRSVRRAA